MVQRPVRVLQRIALGLCGAVEGYVKCPDFVANDAAYLAPRLLCQMQPYPRVKALPHDQAEFPVLIYRLNSDAILLLQMEPVSID